MLTTSPYNANFAWEVTKKLEAAIELGFFNDRLTIESSWYRNRSSNQLVDYQLPYITGFGSVFTNFNATVENSGFEIVLGTINIATAKLRWTSSINFTVPRSKLVKYKGLEEFFLFYYV